MIYIYTRAYNVEKCLSRCVTSIINQSHRDFRYYLIDNGSSDGTRQIISYFSKIDNRIKPLYLNRNRSNLIEEVLDLIYQESNINDYFCTLDADDEYSSDFLEKMIQFMQKNDLEIGACGSDFIDAQASKYIGERSLSQNLIIDGDGFERWFREYYQFMRTVWGKVYRISLLKKCGFSSSKKLNYGSDTLFAMEAFRNANRVGILAETLHKYYIFPKSASYQFDNKRALSDCILFDAACDFLISKTGKVNNENLTFLRFVYLNAIVDTLNVLIKTQISVSDKLAYILDIFQSQHTQELIKWSGAESEKSQLFSQVASWVLSQEEVRSGLEIDLAVDILLAMNFYPSHIEGWHDSWLFILLTKIRDRQIELSHVDDLISSIAHNSPYLLDLDAGFLCHFRDVVFSILQGEEELALSQIEQIIMRQTKIPDKYIEDFLTLALNLSAKLELADYFVYFKKLQISVLIELSRIEDAIAEFADWDKILPDDNDFKNLKERLGI